MIRKKSHAFISYSRADKKFVEQVVHDLTQRGIPVWIDSAGLSPGTSNWEQAIRDAIEQAFAVILVASPDSRQSVYVQGELNVAKIRNCPVYPIWANGREWIDCIQLGMVNYQYIDCRLDQYAAGMDKLVEVMHKIVGNREAETTVSISLPTHETVSVVLSQFESMEGLLNHLFMNYLIDWYQPITYGSEWVLANVTTRQLAVPWGWLLESTGEKPPLFRMDRNWARETPGSFGLEQNTVWAAWEVRRIRGIGFATNNLRLEHRLLSPFGSRDLMLLLGNQCLKPAPANEVDLSKYLIKKVIAVFGTTYKDIAFVDTAKDCTDILR
ncbi:MAG: toll/interleukin-1 receptor domain-containing protein [Anaerolineae bacterium]|jgi:hypothetical protein|nr:toll/interleukin-1 receptor domain-containing protein [Anaerolineae bacterium]